MNKRGAGVSFCAISAFLFFAKYFFKVLLYALEYGTFIANNNGLDMLALRSALNIFNLFSIATLILGIVYLIAGEKEEKKK